MLPIGGRQGVTAALPTAAEALQSCTSDGHGLRPRERASSCRSNAHAPTASSRRGTGSKDLGRDLCLPEVGAAAEASAPLMKRRRGTQIPPAGAGLCTRAGVRAPRGFPQFVVAEIGGCERRWALRNQHLSLGREPRLRAQHVLQPSPAQLRISSRKIFSSVESRTTPPNFDFGDSTPPNFVCCGRAQFQPVLGVRLRLTLGVLFERMGRNFSGIKFGKRFCGRLVSRRRNFQPPSSLSSIRAIFT